MFTKDQFKVLMLLYSEQCTNVMRSFTIKKLASDTQLSTNTIRIAVKTFRELGYMAEGAAIRKAKSYFITSEGIKKIKELSK